MIRVQKVLERDRDDMLARCELMADAMSDWEADPLTIVDMPLGYELQFGSYCITVSGDLGILDSEGTWNWLGVDPELSIVNLNLIKKAQEEKEAKE